MVPIEINWKRAINGFKRTTWNRKNLGGYSGGAPPLPIPNREVKPLMADGTGIPTGRVGSCHIYLKSLTVMWGFLRLYKFEVTLRN